MSKCCQTTEGNLVVSFTGFIEDKKQAQHWKQDLMLLCEKLKSCVCAI